jgi:hypothetical protein
MNNRQGGVSGIAGHEMVLKQGDLLLSRCKRENHREQRDNLPHCYPSPLQAMRKCPVSLLEESVRSSHTKPCNNRQAMVGGHSLTARRREPVLAGPQRILKKRLPAAIPTQ